METLEKLLPGKDEVVRAVQLQNRKSYLERAVKHLLSLDLQCNRKGDLKSAEERSRKTDAPSRLKKTAAVIAAIVRKDQITDENGTLQVE